MDISSFMKKDKDSYVFSKDGTFVFYVPESFFGKKYAVLKGEFIDVMGLLNYTVEDKSGKNNGLHMMMFPSVFTTKPDEIEKVKNIKLTAYTEPGDYRLLKYTKGSQIISHEKVPQMIENCEMFFKMFIYGDIPNTIPYDKMHSLFDQNMRINGNNYGLNKQLFGMMIAEICRSRTDETKLFRNSKSDNYKDYKMITLREIPKKMSTYTSITSENWDEAVVNGIVNKNTAYSPLERLFTI